MLGALKKTPFHFVEKKLSERYADYQHDMNGVEFEHWFQKTLIPNLPKEKKVVILMDNAKYHSRFIEKAPIMNTKKEEMVAFM